MKEEEEGGATRRGKAHTTSMVRHGMMVGGRRSDEMRHTRRKWHGMGGMGWDDIDAHTTSTSTG